MFICQCMNIHLHFGWFCIVLCWHGPCVQAGAGRVVCDPTGIWICVQALRDAESVLPKTQTAGIGAHQFSDTAFQPRYDTLLNCRMSSGSQSMAMTTIGEAKRQTGIHYYPRLRMNHILLVNWVW